MAKFLDLTGLSQFKDKIQEWANGAFRKTTDKISTDDVTYNGNNLTTAITSGEFKGEKGDQGPQGPKGEQGIQGETGPAGAAATVSVGEVTSGDTAKVTNSGNANAAVFDFVLPRGPQGPQGIQGPAGPQGPAGSDANVEAITEGEIDALFSA